MSYNHNFYKNVVSVKNAFNEKKVGFNLNHAHIIQIGESLKVYESSNKTQKPNYYYARDDITFVINYIYQKPVLYNRRGNLNYIKSYHTHKNKKYTPVLFDTLENFPLYQRYR